MPFPLTTALKAEFPEIEGIDAFETVGRTLDRLAELDVDWIIPGHGQPFQNMTAALERARGRLNGFLTNPGRHARHAAKVLIKFHLLEVQHADRDQLIEWMATTRYLQLTHARYFESLSLTDWAAALLNELAAATAIKVVGNSIYDH